MEKRSLCQDGSSRGFENYHYAYSSRRETLNRISSQRSASEKKESCSMTALIGVSTFINEGDSIIGSVSLSYRRNFL